ncbi:MAG: HemK/PrmC family methyltransferase [Collinsella sp.]|nr:HemK/PrmC family methyltransferase [Collinsella sp.]
MADGTWTISSCLEWTRGYLEGKGDVRARYTAELLLTSVTGLSRVDIYMNFDKPLSRGELDRMHDAVVRRAKGEPVQYITGSTGFRMIDVMCEPGVLIPRPETEVLVGEVLDFLDRGPLGLVGPDGTQVQRRKRELPWSEDMARHLDAPVDGESAQPIDVEDGADGDGGAPAVGSARVLEVGCGTGCISLSLVIERPEAVTCVATDISQQAVLLAKRNRDALGVDPLALSIREGDLVSPVAEDELGTFDVLVSNPPYIPSGVMSSLPREVVDHEPSLALEGGEDGLDVFRRLVDAAPSVLRPGGLLACELFEESLEDAAGICRAAGMRDVGIVKDLTGRPRIILARI